MRNNLLSFTRSRIVLFACCLLFLNLSAICQTSTTKSDGGRVFDANDHIQEITRDLKLCDAVKAERDILAEYNTALKIQLQTESTQRIKAESDRRKYQVRAKRRFRVIVVLGVVILINIAITK